MVISKCFFLFCILSDTKIRINSDICKFLTLFNIIINES